MHRADIKLEQSSHNKALEIDTVERNSVSHAVLIPGLGRLLVRLWRHLSRRRQLQFCLLLTLMLASAAAEVLSLGAIIPFLSVLAVPERVFDMPLVASAGKMLGIATPQQMLSPLTLLFCIAALTAGSIRVLYLWVSTKLAFVTGADLGSQVYRRTLYQPYEVHVARNSSEVISGITTRAHSVVNGVLLPMLTIVSATVLLTALLCALIVISPGVALGTIAAFGLSYAALTWLLRHRLKQNSMRIASEQTHVVKALQEGLGGIRDVLLDGTQEVYCNLYGKADITLRQAEGSNTFIAQCPRYAMEAIGMVLIAVLAFVLVGQSGGVATALPVLGILALGALRILPVLQQGYSAWASIAGHHAALAETIDLLDQPFPDYVTAGASDPPPAPLSFCRTIRFDNVRFRYALQAPWVLDGINLTIAKGMRVGFVGATGSGKSTALDVLMGLLRPEQGALVVDEKPLPAVSIRAWQRNIAHVPQSVFLADTSVAENIAFGVLPGDIDMERVKSAARKAQIADFIEGRPGGYAAHVGERGIQLSGGQRQRIGIARALYKNANVLVLDESTSALDNVTEHAVMQAIEGLGRELTVLMIAHRLTTIRHCDMIVELANGRVVGSGAYDELLLNSPTFRQLAQAVETPAASRS